MRTWKPALAKSDWPKKKKKTQNKKQTKKTTKGKKKEIKKDWKITKPSQPSLPRNHLENKMFW